MTGEFGFLALCPRNVLQSLMTYGSFHLVVGNSTFFFRLVHRLLSLSIPTNAKFRLWSCCVSKYLVMPPPPSQQEGLNTPATPTERGSSRRTVPSVPRRGNTAGRAGRPSRVSAAIPPVPPPLSLGPTLVPTVQPFLLHHARIATILYDAKLRSMADSTPLIADLAANYPAANSLATNLAQHALSARQAYSGAHAHTGANPTAGGPPRPTYFRRVNVASMARFLGFVGGLFTFLRLWIVLSLALSKVFANFVQSPELSDLINQLVSQVMARGIDMHFYEWFVKVMSHEDPLLILQSPVNYAGFEFSPSLYISFFLSLPLIEGAFCYVFGVIMAFTINVALSLSHGIRVENRDN